MNDIDPQAYLTDILARIADHPINKIDDLLPLALDKVAQRRRQDGTSNRGHRLALLTVGRLVRLDAPKGPAPSPAEPPSVAPPAKQAPKPSKPTAT